MQVLWGLTSTILELSMVCVHILFLAIEQVQKCTLRAVTMLIMEFFTFLISSALVRTHRLITLIFALMNGDVQLYAKSEAGFYQQLKTQARFS